MLRELCMQGEFLLFPTSSENILHKARSLDRKLVVDVDHFVFLIADGCLLFRSRSRSAVTFSVATIYWRNQKIYERLFTVPNVSNLDRYRCLPLLSSSEATIVGFSLVVRNYKLCDQSNRCRSLSYCNKLWVQVCRSFSLSNLLKFVLQLLAQEYGRL